MLPYFLSLSQAESTGWSRVLRWTTYIWCWWPWSGCVRSTTLMPVSASASMTRCDTSSAANTVTEQHWHFRSQTCLRGELTALPVITPVEHVMTPLIVCFCLLQEYVCSYVRHAGPSPVSSFLQFCWYWPVFEKGGHHGLCDAFQPHRSGTKIRPATRWDLHAITSHYFLL